MLTLKAQPRKDLKKKAKDIRKEGKIPGILYGPAIDNLPLEVDFKEFEKVYKEAGTNSLISVEADKKKFLVLIHAVEFEAISRKPMHIDFYQPRLDKEIAATVPLVFEGEAMAVRDLGGTLVRNIRELEVRALPQDLPHEIKVSVEKLATFQDSILVKDIILPEKVKTLKNPEETVALVSAPQKAEEELVKPAEEEAAGIAKAEEKGEEAKEQKEEEPAEKSKG